MNPLAWIRERLPENFAIQCVAFLFTALLFIWVRGDREATVVAHAAVRIEIPDNMVLVSSPLERVRITVRGRQSDVNRFDPTEVPPLNIVATSDSEQTVTLTADMVQLPVGLDVVQITPEFARIRLEALAKKKVAIVPRIAGEPRPDYVVGHPEVSPAQIEIAGPMSSIEKISGVSTELIDITDRTQSIDRRVQLRLDDPLVRYDATTNVNVRIPIDTVEITRTFDRIKVLAINTTRQATISPTSLNVTLRGPRAALDGLEPEELLATIDLSAEEKRGAGTFEKQPVVKNLPVGVTLVDYHPKNVIVSTLPHSSQPDDP